MCGAAGCLALVTLGSSIAAAADAGRSPRITAVRANADAHVTAARRTANFGEARRLAVDGRPVARTYVRFRIENNGPSGNVTRMNLLLYSYTYSRLGFQVRLVRQSWSEGRITWQNAPGVSSRRVSSGPVRKRAWKAIDVTSLVDPNEDAVSFAVTTVGTRQIELASRENGVRGPRLVIERETEIGSGTEGRTP